MDFKNASLEELKQFVKEHKIKGVSALRKPALIEFLEKNYSDEADHAKENQDVNSQKKDAEKIKKNGLDKVKEYSALSYLSGEEVTRLIYWLIGRHYIIKTTGQYPVLHVTSEGLKYAELFTPRIAGNLLKWLETEVDRRLLDEQDI